MSDRLCARCKQPMVQLEGEFVLLAGSDVPAWGSKTEVMVTPKKSLRVIVWKCPQPQCAAIEFASPPPPSA